MSVQINEVNFSQPNVGAQFVEVSGPSGTNLSGYRLFYYTNPAPGVLRLQGQANLNGVLFDQSNGGGTRSIPATVPEIVAVGLLDPQQQTLQLVTEVSPTQPIQGGPPGFNNPSIRIVVPTESLNSTSVQRVGSPNNTTFSQSPPSPGQPNTGQTLDCFLTGTKLLTATGECKVEDLKVGDLVKTAEGKLEAVKWVGLQTFDGQNPHPFRTYPICITAGALGHSLPIRDLYVSPDHAILVDGILVNAGALVNNKSIFEVKIEQFIYYHIELENHSLLLAEGTPAESYLPQNQGREEFDNGDEYEQLYPGHNTFSLMPMSFPRVSSQRQLPKSVRKRLLQVAETLNDSEVVTQSTPVSASVCVM